MTETLRKTVDLTDEVDDARRIATGAVLVPNQVDNQGDYFAPETVRDIAADYMARLQRGGAGLKFMHAVGAGQKLSLVENRVLNSAEQIGDAEYDAGAWIVSVKAHDKQTWRAFTRGLFGGFSIGGEIESASTLEPAQLPPAVGVPEEHPSDAPVREIEAATINEFSAVDQPAVPEATVDILKTEKADARLEDPAETVAALVERGHDEEDAELLRDVMHKATVNGTDVNLTPPGEPREWAMRRANEIAEARDNEPPYSEVQTMTRTTKQDHSPGDWVIWEQAAGDTRGQVVDIEEEEGETFPDGASGEANIPQARAEAERPCPKPGAGPARLWPAGRAPLRTWPVLCAREEAPRQSQGPGR